MTTHPHATIRVRNLWKRFKTHTVLAGVTLDIPREKVTVIVGRSGEGKSVLLKNIIGLLEPDEGEIWIDDLNIAHADELAWNHIRRRFGMLFQNGALFDSMTVFENVAFPLIESRQYKEKNIAEIVREKLAQVGLHNVEHKMPSELSGGMRKRVGLARAIVLNPEIMLYDEPTTGLDPIMTDSIYDLINKMQRELKTTSVVISHDMEGALKIADKIVVLDKGKIVEDCPASEIMARSSPLVRAFFHREKGFAERNEA